MNKHKLNTSRLIVLIGALFAYLVGAGFATGQETVQFFSGWGSLWAPLLIGLITFVMMYLSYSAYAYVGRTREIDDVTQIFQFYAGSVCGRIFSAFAWAYNASAYVFMVSGFGNVMYQQWGVSVEIGSALAVIVSVGTAVAGLNRIVEITGKIGPLLITFTLVIAIISAFKYYPLVEQGNQAINSAQVQVTRAGASVVLSGLSYGGVCLLFASAMVGRMGVELRGYDFRYTKIILCAVAFALPFINIVMALNHIGNIEVSSVAPIPNLILADNIFGAMSVMFAIIILLAVYSSLCPIIWTCSSMISKSEKSTRYKLICVILGICVYGITLFVPYQKLLNHIMTFGGYAGAIVFAVITVRYSVILVNDKDSAKA